MVETIKVTLPEGEKTVPKGITLQELLNAYPEKGRPPIVAAKVGNKLKELGYKLEDHATVQPVGMNSPDGVRIYSRSLKIVMIRAARELFPDCRVLFEHSLGKGLYGEMDIGRPLTEKDLKRVEERMREIIEADEKISKLVVSVGEAIQIFERDGQVDKVRLLSYRKDPVVRIYKCGWFHDYFYGYMLPSTGFLRLFELRFYIPGFILRFPVQEDPWEIPPFVDQRKLASVFYESEKWGRVLEVSDVASLNKQIAEGKGGDLIRVAEALHEKKIAQLADQITQDRGRIRLVLVAGPSSSGKTTFAQRLAIQLRVNGVKPISISLDDYFVDRERTPLNEKGEPDFEALEAIDLELFNHQLTSLITGEEIEIPRYNFLTGRREKRGEVIRINQDQPIIIEGIHGLNERLTEAVPKDRKFKIYVSALTQLNLDNHNRIPTTDNRLIRRIVRDSKFRSHDAVTTLRLWPAVRRGEEKNIFPYQEEADAMFNSALVYELAVLKRYIEPLLMVIGADLPEYSEANRLLKFLSYFLPLADRDVPLNSILREFIGESCFLC